LLGYNDPITESDMRHHIRDVATFPTIEMFADDFVNLAKWSELALEKAKAIDYAQILFSKHSVIDRCAMEALTAEAEMLGQKLLQGQQL
jgi:hypothetical protein